VGDRSFFRSGGRLGDPFAEVAPKLDAALVMESQDFPGAYGREPKFVVLVVQAAKDWAIQFRGVVQQPKPNVGVQ
jgi:hypothetical protein